MTEITNNHPDDSLAHVAWQTLRQDIISGKLEPNSWLRIAKLRESYGIGASPLREALSRLVSDGFVIAQERRGFLVAPMSLAEFRDLTNLRKLLEKEALKSSLEHGDDEWEAQVLGAYHRLTRVQKRMVPGDEVSREQWEMRNHDFHESLVAACTSPYTLRFRSMVYSYTERYRRVCLSIYSVKRDVHEEHSQLCDAALKRDIAKVCDIADRHLEATFTKIKESGTLE